MKYLMVVARNNLNSQYLLIYLLLKTVCFPKLERGHSKSITKRLFLQCSTQLPSVHKSSLNIPNRTWPLLPVNLQSPWSTPLSALTMLSFMIIIYVYVLSYFPLWFTSALWVGPEYDSSLDLSQHLAHSLTDYSWMKGQESSWVWPFWEKEVSRKGWPWNRLNGIAWTTKGSGYTSYPVKLSINEVLSGPLKQEGQQSEIHLKLTYWSEFKIKGQGRKATMSPSPTPWSCKADWKPGNTGAYHSWV